MTWAAKRQLIYASVVLAFLFIVVGVPVYLNFFNKTPTCFDGIINQNERGPDCGGVCSKACMDEVIAEPIVKWARAFPVSGSMYNLTAYIENPNIIYFGAPTAYRFKIFDKENRLINQADGITILPPTNNFAVFVPGFDSAERIPDHVTFEFTDRVIWLRYAGDKAEMSVSGKSLSNVSVAPRLDATVTNKTVMTYKNIEVVAILYDNTGNAVQTSRTYIPALSDHASEKITFTWPEQFNKQIASIEIIPTVPFGGR